MTTVYLDEVDVSQLSLSDLKFVKYSSAVSSDSNIRLKGHHEARILYGDNKSRCLIVFENTMVPFGVQCKPPDKPRSKYYGTIDINTSPEQSAHVTAIEEQLFTLARQTQLPFSYPAEKKLVRQGRIKSTAPDGTVERWPDMLKFQVPLSTNYETKKPRVVYDTMQNPVYVVDRKQVKVFYADSEVDFPEHNFKMTRFNHVYIWLKTVKFCAKNGVRIVGELVQLEVPEYAPCKPPKRRRVAV